MNTKISRELFSLARKEILKNDLISEGAHVTIALSGGKDSLTLMRILAEIAGRGVPSYTLHAAHVSGEFSCGAGVDINYLQSECDQLKIPLSILKSHQKLETLECYSCSRERRKLLFDCAKENGSTTVAFGHHRDDHIQTLIMNLLQKGEFAGNLSKVPMIHYGITIIRPLLLISEEQIITFAQQMGFLRAMCRCPVGQTSVRKKAEDLIRTIEEVFPHARANLAKAGWEQGSDGALRI